MAWWKKQAKTCSCGNPPVSGYSSCAETQLKNIEPVCNGCLLSRFAQEVSTYQNKAVILEPSEDFPCYVFQPLDGLQAISSSVFLDDVSSLLSGMDPLCKKCDKLSSFLWIGSAELSAAEQTRFFQEGISKTLNTSSKVSLCVDCCVESLRRYFPPLQFLEVCAPKNRDGVQLPMGY